MPVNIMTYSGRAGLGWALVLKLSLDRQLPSICSDALRVSEGLVGLMSCHALFYLAQRGSQGLNSILIFWKEFDGVEHVSCQCPSDRT